MTINNMSEDISAFPDPGRAQSAKQRQVLTERGMTLRDYFAAKAMTSVIATASTKNDSTPAECMKLIARVSYGIADAMLKERNK
jgi:hypothetical protein